MKTADRNVNATSASLPRITQAPARTGSTRGWVWSRVLALGLITGPLSMTAEAAYISTIAGNDCAGVYGTPPNCIVPANPRAGIPNNTPLIIKFDFNSSGVITQTTLGVFPSILGNEFTFDFFSDNDGSTGTGTWTYTPGPGGPLIGAYVAKGGPNFNLFSNGGAPTNDSFFTPTNSNNNNPYGLSHLSFYDTATGPGIPLSQIPAPASGLLLSMGLVGLGLMHWRRPSPRLRWAWRG